ncbi:MAG: triose-phosphate isomerase [Verrucomicrobia bacterium]|nr:triose-phosphate isomerase [Verrucomicrobiota bacterium]
MNRIPLIAGNWKMYKTSADARAFVSALSEEIAATERRVFLAVPFTAIEGASDSAKGTRISIGGQNMHDEPEGAFTGEISGRMLKGSGASFVILGHSERRQYFAETDSFIHRKLMRALQEGLTPVLCVGELPHERDSGEHEKVLNLQLEECLQGITSAQASEIVIAYEPVWAIGTGKTATPEIAQAVHRFIRGWLESRFGLNCAEKMCLLYGGSVKPDNISMLMQQTDIDGVLVGGASLDVKTFAQIVNY